MSTLAVLLVILSAIMHATRNYLTKKASDKQAFVWWYEVVGLLLFTPIFLYFLPEVAFISIADWYLLLISGLLHAAYWILLTKALDYGDLSLVYPVMRASPALVLIVSVVGLHEAVSWRGIAGILLVTTGSYTINMQRLRWDELTRPLRGLVHDPGMRFALATLFAVAAYSVIDKLAVNQIHPVVFAYIYPWFSMLLYSAYLVCVKRNREVKREWQIHRRGILACGFLSIFGYFLILLAFTIDRVSYIVGLRQLSIVFAVLLGGYALNEKHRKIRLVSALVIFLGSFLIAVG